MARLLLIEPDRKLAATYAKAFQANGYAVTTCASAQKGILAADAKKPDLVVLELQLVAHSGIEFLYEFRSYADWQQIPVVIFSNVPLREFSNSIKLLQRLGVRAYYYKPQTSLKMLLDGVEAVLEDLLSIEKTAQ